MQPARNFARRGTPSPCRPLLVEYCAMQASCQYCDSKHILDDKQIGDHARVKFRCANCGQTTEVDLGKDSNRTTISSVRAEAVPFVEPTVIEDQRGLGLPKDKELKLHVTAGKSQGTSHVLDRPRLIVGRLGADFAIEDSEVSRWHCAIEVSGEQVNVRDLDSRNGVFVGDKRIKTSPLQNESEFRIGSTVFRLSITPK